MGKAWTARALKKPTQDAVKHLAGVDRSRIQRRLTARFEFEHALSKKAITTVAIDAQATRTMNKLSPKSLSQQGQQMRIGNLAVIRSKARAGALALNLNTSQS